MKRILFGLFLAIGVFAHNANATSVIPKSLEQLTEEAELIFIGEVEKQETARSTDREHIFTFVTFKVLEIVKGKYEKIRSIYG
jgi:hypothetical protein